MTSVLGFELWLFGSVGEVGGQDNKETRWERGKRREGDRCEGRDELMRRWVLASCGGTRTVGIGHSWAWLGLGRNAG